MALFQRGHAWPATTFKDWRQSWSGRWRRGRDSNPRYGCPYAAFRVRCIQPLCHLSGTRNGCLKRALSSEGRPARQGRAHGAAGAAVYDARARPGHARFSIAQAGATANSTTGISAPPIRRPTTPDSAAATVHSTAPASAGSRLSRRHGDGVDAMAEPGRAVRLEPMHDDAAADPDHGGRADHAEHPQEVRHTEHEGAAERAAQAEPSAERLRLRRQRHADIVGLHDQRHRAVDRDRDADRRPPPARRPGSARRPREAPPA